MARLRDILKGFGQGDPPNKLSNIELNFSQLAGVVSRTDLIAQSICRVCNVYYNGIGLTVHETHLLYKIADINCVFLKNEM